MSNRQLDIADMECWVFRMAQKKWNISGNACAEVFRKYDVLGFIHECYDLLHLTSYACVLDDVERMIKNRGEMV